MIIWNLKRTGQWQNVRVEFGFVSFAASFLIRISAFYTTLIGPSVNCVCFSAWLCCSVFSAQLSPTSQPSPASRSLNSCDVVDIEKSLDWDTWMLVCKMVSNKASLRHNLIKVDKVYPNPTSFYNTVWFPRMYILYICQICDILQLGSTVAELTCKWSRRPHLDQLPHQCQWSWQLCSSSCSIQRSSRLPRTCSHSCSLVVEEMVDWPCRLPCVGNPDSSLHHWPRPWRVSSQPVPHLLHLVQGGKAAEDHLGVGLLHLGDQHLHGQPWVRWANNSMQARCRLGKFISALPLPTTCRGGCVLSVEPLASPKALLNLSPFSPHCIGQPLPSPCSFAWFRIRSS